MNSTPMVLLQSLSLQAQRGTPRPPRKLLLRGRSRQGDGKEQSARQGMLFMMQLSHEGKYIVNIDKSIKIEDIKANLRVAVRSDNYILHKILPTKVDPLVSLMKVEKVPDSTYDMIGGLDQQVKEVKEVIELPIKHPEIFESLGIAQPKGVLMYGPPGTGKTLLARAIAHHTDCTFIRVSGSELVQKYIG
jgi:26S proteasome regulatory subunit T6